jgi:hypothetical protein
MTNELIQSFAEHDGGFGPEDAGAVSDLSHGTIEKKPFCDSSESSTSSTS